MGDEDYAADESFNDLCACGHGRDEHCTLHPGSGCQVCDCDDFEE